MRVWQEKLDFCRLLQEDSAIKEKYNNNFNEKTIADLFDINYHLKGVETIFNSVFGN